MRARSAPLCLALLLAAAAPAGAQVSPYDGSIPFDCVLQQAGEGTDFPDPGADPFCVEYEKRNQNITQAGVVEFMAQEPARVAAASPKCFYYQRDHWRGSVAQDNAATKTYEWDGGYFFDKALGTGGVYLENFSFAGQASDPRLLPGFPEEWKPHFGPGRGGVQSAGSVAQDPRCVEAAEKDPPRPTPADQERRCRVPGGRVRRGIGGVRLGMRRMHVRRALGQPSTEGRGYLSWCLDGGARLVAAFRSDRDRSRVRLVLTDAPAFDIRGARRRARGSRKAKRRLPGVSVGLASRKAKRRLRGERRMGRYGKTVIYSVRRRRQRLLVGFAAGHVSLLGVSRPRLARRLTLSYLRRSP